MAAIDSAFVGFTASLFHSATAPATIDAAGLATFITASGNSVSNPTAIGDIQDGERAIVEYNVFGSDDTSSLLGQRGAVDWSFDVALSLGDTKHVALRDAAPTATQHFVIHFDNTNGSNTSGTDVYFTGFITSAVVSTPVDGVVTMSVSVRLTSSLSWVDTA